MTASSPVARLMAWLGGAMFVASLAFFGWTYFLRFGDVTADGPVTTAVLVDLTLFTAFAVHHSVLARSGAKRWLVRHLPAHLERSSYVWVASVLFIGVCALWAPIPGVAYHHVGLAAVPHWLAVGLGGWLTVRSAGVIDPLELAGIRQTYGDAATPRFRVVGPYHLVRHPIYLGWLLLVFGVPHMTGTRLAFAVISSAYLIVAIPFEERSLIEAVGDDYVTYRHAVRWRLIPGIW